MLRSSFESGAGLPVARRVLCAVCPVLAMMILCFWNLFSFAQTSPVGDDLRTYLQRAEDALKEKNLPLAAEQFRAVLKLDPHNAEALANLGVLAYSQGNCADAEQDLRSALKAQPSLVNAEGLLAVCERRTGNPNAEADLVDAFAKLADPKLRIQVGMQLADDYYQNGDMDRTLPVLHKLIDIAPDNVDILFFAQRIYSELADDTLNKLALVAPDSARMQQLIAERLINAGDLLGAIDHYRKALAIAPRLPGVHFELAEAILEQSNEFNAWKAAREQLDEAVKADGDSPQIECAYGRIAKLQGDTDAVMEHYSRADQMDPGNAQAQLGLGAAFADQGKPKQALGFLQRAVKSDPMNADAHYRLARVDQALHLDEAAQKEIRLYKEIRQADDRMAALYREMSLRPLVKDAPVAAETKP